jgi:pimeloyl-ACP methyl ester carboxylesterase
MPVVFVHGVPETAALWDDVRAVLGRPDAVALSLPFEELGVPQRRAREMAARIDRTMADCILALYRSATDIGREWAPDLARITAPGRVVIPELDPFLVGESARRVASDSRVPVVHLEGLGHRWPVQAPERGAELLSGFWSTLP